MLVRLFANRNLGRRAAYAIMRLSAEQVRGVRDAAELRRREPGGASAI
jgi:hypothetical protein